MILNSDARHLLTALPDNSVDLIITDVPYRTISGGNSIGKDGLGAYGRPTGMLTKNDGKIFQHNDLPVTEYAADLFRVLKSPGHMWWFTNELNRRAHEDALHAVGFKTHALTGWLKNTCTPNRWGMKNWEPVFLFRKGPARGLYTPGMKQMHFAENPTGRKRHPTEKPVALLRDYVRASSQPGDTVLDPFVGAGSTAIACLEEGRQFIGSEIDPEYYEIACERVNRG